MQDCPLTYETPTYEPTACSHADLFSNSDLIFNVPQLVSFLSQGTTLPAGTIILTGTPPGVGAAKNPKEFLTAGDEFAVELLPHVGTLINKIEHQK